MNPSTETSSGAETAGPDPKVRAPGGEVFDLVGTAAPVELASAPRVQAQTSDELLIVKEGAIFMCSHRDGDVRAHPPTGQGLYFRDTRYLSDLALELSGRAPITLASTSNPAYGAVIDQTNPDLPGDTPQMTLKLRRSRLIYGRLYERVAIKNHGSERAEFELTIRLAADFADMFEIRGVSDRRARGQALAPNRRPDGVTFGYLGRDEVFRTTTVRLDPVATSATLENGSALLAWELGLDPRESTTIEVVVDVDDDHGDPPDFDLALERLKQRSSSWSSAGAGISSPNKPFTRVIEASIRDLQALSTTIGENMVMAAGIPWYVAPFGRDALWTCYEMMLLNPLPARDTLMFLARHQAKEDDSARDAEPGKILHELRVGELAGAGLIPHTPYYGSVDSTPLFLMLAGAYYRWTNDLQSMVELRPAIDAAIEWIDEHGDVDGDGFVEYERRSPAGLQNQGWKDSEDCIVHRDGSLAQGPIALAEVQGYVFLAKHRIAEVLEALGDSDRADALRASADELRRAFNQAFWLDDEQCFALALDGAKNQVASVASNQGHCLYCNLVDPDKAEAVVTRLMAEDMFSGWGIRTLSKVSPAYNPMSYHNGSVWPHDNAIIAAGFKRYGFTKETERLATALFDAADVSNGSRLPELFCGFTRLPEVPYVPYPVACRPQAWAAAAPFMMLQALLGISARAHEGVLTVNQPDVLPWLGQIELRKIQVAGSRVALAFTRYGDVTAFSLLERSGDVTVTLQE